MDLTLTDSTRDTLFLFLEIVRMGFVSKDSTVVAWSINLTSKIVYTLSARDYTVEVYEYFAKQCKFVPVALSRNKGYTTCHQET